MYLIIIFMDEFDNLKKMVDEYNFLYFVLLDKNLEVLKVFDVFFYGEDVLYEDYGVYGEFVYFFVDEKGCFFY